MDLTLSTPPNPSPAGRGTSAADGLGEGSLDGTTRLLCRDVLRTSAGLAKINH